MNEFIKKLMTQEEFNSIAVMDRMAIERESILAKDALTWTLIIRYCNLTEDTLRQFADRLDWHEVSVVGKYLTKQFIEDFKDKLDWSELSQYHMFTKEQLLQYIDYIDWDRAPTFQPAIDEEVIDAVMASSKKDEFNWHGALVKVKMSETFLEKYAVKANKWEIVSYYQNLSEKFMEKFADKLNWNYISQKQHLSRKFMVKHFDKLNALWLKKFQKNWDDDIEKEYEFYKAENNWMKDQNLLNEVKVAFAKHGYDFDIFSKFFTNNL